MAKLTLSDLANLNNQTSAVNIINNNNALIETAMENTLSRDGTAPNSMSANLDMNSNRIVNLPAASANTEPVRKLEFDDAIGDAQSNADSAAASAAAAAVSASAASSSASSASISASNASASAAAAATSESNAAASAAQLIGTSTTSNSIGTGTKSFTTQSGKFFAAGNYVLITSDASPATRVMAGQVTAYSGTSLTVDVDTTEGSGTYTDWTIRVSGPTTGPAGSAGADGFFPTLKWLYNTNTTDADPGVGQFKFNSATLSSVTFLYIDNQETEGSTTVTAWLDSFDDSTNTANRGQIMVTEAATPTTFAIFTITGAVIDGTGYRKVPVSHVVSSGTFTALGSVAFAFFRTGDKGTDGVGAGDVVGPASAVDGRFTLFDGTTGKLIKQHTGAPGALAVLNTVGTSQIDNDSVTYAKMQNISATDRLLGRDTAAAGDTEELTVSGGLEFTGAGGIQRSALTGDVTASAGSGSTTIANDAVTFAKMQNIATARVIGNVSGSTGDPAEVTIGTSTNQVAPGTVTQGKQTIWIPAGAMVSRTTNGAASGTIQRTTNLLMFKTLDYDTTTQEFAQFQVAMPKSWNESTFTFQVYWTHPSTTTDFGVVWEMNAVAMSDDDVTDVAFGTAVEVSDTGGTTDDLYITAESSAVTIAGTPAEGDLVQFQIARDPGNGSDTLAVDARLIGVKIFYTTNADTDA